MASSHSGGSGDGDEAEDAGRPTQVGTRVLEWIDALQPPRDAVRSTAVGAQQMEQPLASEDPLGGASLQVKDASGNVLAVVASVTHQPTGKVVTRSQLGSAFMRRRSNLVSKGLCPAGRSVPRYAPRMPETDLFERRHRGPRRIRSSSWMAPRWREMPAESRARPPPPSPQPRR